MAEKEIYRMSLRERFWRWQVSRENAREDAYVFKETRKRLLNEAKTTGLIEGREEGRAEGREEGRAEGRAEGREEGRAEGREEGREEGRAAGREEGREEGRAAGAAEGRAAAVQEVACNMKKKGIPNEVISQCTGMPVAEIENIVVADSV